MEDKAETLPKANNQNKDSIIKQPLHCEKQCTASRFIKYTLNKLDRSMVKKVEVTRNNVTV